MNRTARGQPQAAASIDIVVHSPLWRAHRGLGRVLRGAIAEAACATNQGGELALVLTDDASIRIMNRDWRRKNEATNVLSFPAPHRPHPKDRPIRSVPQGHLGDIVIAYQTTAREAKAERKPFDHHVAHLAVHGFLHLIGYDHESSAEAKAMERLEIAVLAAIRVPNPYALHDRAS
jgi:probable rRNA maturation factor